MNSHQQLVTRHARESGRKAVLHAQRGRGTAICKLVGVKLDREPAAAQTARRAVEALEHKLDRTVLGDLRLLVSELVANSVRHTGAAGADQIGLDVMLNDGVLRVEVSDRGGGFEPRPRAPDQSKASGWGLYLVDRLADRWGVIRDELTRVWFEIDGDGSRHPHERAR